jgi:MFS family permease
VLTALRREYRSLPSAYWTIWLGTLVNRMGGFVVPFMALYITRERHESEATAGAVMSLYGAGSILAGFVGGTLADRLGRRATILLSLFGGAAAMLSVGLASSLPQICVATFVMGWLAEMYRPAVSAMVADVVPPADRQRAYAHLYWVVNLGFAIAPLLAGLAARASYLTLFIVDAATMGAYGLIVLLRVRETRPAEAAAAGGGGPGIGTVLSDRTFMGFVLLTLGTAVVMWQNGTALPMDMVRHGISAGGYGALVAINGVMIVFLQPIITRAIGKRSRTRVLALSALLLGVGFGLHGVVGTYAGYALAIAVWTLAEIANLPMSSAVVADLAPTALRGRYQGVYGMTWGLASCVGPLLGGLFLSGPGGRALWFSCFGIMALVACGQVAIGRARERRERAFPPSVPAAAV